MQPFSLLSSQQNNSVPSLRAQDNYSGITGSRVGPNPFLASEIKVEAFWKGFWERWKVRVKPREHQSSFLPDWNAVMEDYDHH